MIPVLLGITPALIIPALLLAFKDSIWPALLAYHIFCFGTPLASKWGVQKAGFVKTTSRNWVFLTIFLSLFLLVAGKAATMLGVKALMPEGLETLLQRIHPWNWYIFYTLSVNPLAEEYFWRGYLLPKTGVLPGAFLFWLMHITGAAVFVGWNSLWFTFPAMTAGLLWGWMRRRFGTLWPCIIVHFAADAVILYLAMRMYAVAT